MSKSPTEKVGSFPEAGCAAPQDVSLQSFFKPSSCLIPVAHYLKTRKLAISRVTIRIQITPKPESTLLEYLRDRVVR